MFVCCRQKPSVDLYGNAETIEIPENVAESIMDIAENYRYITLDPGDNIDAMLGAITKIRVFRDRFYIMDNVFTDKLLIFNIDGTFFKKVSSLGRGPKEYIDLTTFELDYVRGELLIRDNVGRKILIFDLDGNYKRTIDNQSIRGEGIAVLPNGNLVYGVEAAISNSNELNDFKLIVCDKENNPLNWHFKDNTNYKFGHLSLNFTNPGFDGTVTFSPQLMNDVYRISDAGVERIYSIDFPDMLDRKDYEKYDHPLSFDKSSSARKTIFTGTHADSDNYFYFRYSYRTETHHAYYNKKDKSLLVCSDKLCANELTFDEQGNLWGSLSESDLLFDESKKAIEIKDIIKESGNPILVSYDLK
jgi:hypothetical protein